MWAHHYLILEYYWNGNTSLMFGQTSTEQLIEEKPVCVHSMYTEYSTGSNVGIALDDIGQLLDWQYQFNIQTNVY